MATRMKILIWIFTLLGALPQWGICQDSLRVVILSPRLGPVIDLDERNQFHIFYAIQDFQQAVVLRARSGLFYVHIITAGRKSPSAQSLASYSRRSLELMAEKVDHFEGLVDRTYVVGSEPVHLMYQDGTPVEADNLPPAMKPDTAIHYIGVETLPGAKSLKSQDQDSWDLLPFGRHKNPSLPGSYPFFSFGLGISTYSPAGGGFVGMMDAYEALYAGKGTPVGKANPVGVSEYMLCYDLRVQLTPLFGTAIDFAESRNGEAIVLKTVSFGVLARLSVDPGGVFWPYAELGVMYCNLRVDKRIDYPVPVQGLSGYPALQLSGGGAKWGGSMMLGIEMCKPTESVIGVKLYFRYFMMPGFEMGSTWGDTRVLKLNSFVVGLSLLWAI